MGSPVSSLNCDRQQIVKFKDALRFVTGNRLCRRAFLLCTGQQSSAVVDKTGKKTANVVRRIRFSALVNKVELSLATKTHASQDHHMLRKLFTLSEKTSSFLPPAQTLLFWLLTGGFGFRFKKNSRQ